MRARRGEPFRRVGRELLLQRFGDELLERLAALGGRRLGLAKQGVRNLERRLHAPILPYLRLARQSQTRGAVSPARPARRDHATDDAGRRRCARRRSSPAPARTGAPRLPSRGTSAIVRRHDRRHAGPRIAHVLLPAPAAALRRLGQCRQAAAAHAPRRPRPLPQLGLDRRGAARRVAHHRARPARPRRQPVVARRQLHDGRLHLRPGPAHPPAAAGARHDHRALARRQHRAPLRRHLSGDGGEARRHRGARPRAGARSPSGAAQDDRRAHGRVDPRAARPRRPPAPALRLDRGRLPPHAGGEPAPVRRAGAPPHRARRQPERGRHV